MYFDLFLNNKKRNEIHTYFNFDVIHKSLYQFTGSYNMLKHGLRPVILIFTIIHVTFGGITETKGLVFDFLIFSQFSLIFSHKRNCYTKKLNYLVKCQFLND